MERASPTLLQLEVETQAFHDDADRGWLSLVEPGVTRRAYAEQLAHAFRFEAPFEAALAYTPHAPSLLGRRMRSRLLAADLFALDYPVARLAPRMIAPFPSVAEALGWLYVVERAARLHERVCRSITSRMPELVNATSYVSDGDADERWRQLGSVLDRAVRTPRIANTVIAAAHDAFRCWLDWYVDNEPLRRGA